MRPLKCGNRSHGNIKKARQGLKNAKVSGGKGKGLQGQVQRTHGQ